MTESLSRTPVAQPFRTLMSHDLVFDNARRDRASAKQAKDETTSTRAKTAAFTAEKPSLQALTKAMAEATSIRTKTAAASAVENTVPNSNWDVLTKAITPIEVGMAGGKIAAASAAMTEVQPRRLIEQVVTEVDTFVTAIGNFSIFTLDLSHDSDVGFFQRKVFHDFFTGARCLLS